MHLDFSSFSVAIIMMTDCSWAGEMNSENSWITFLSQDSGMTLLYKMRPDGTALSPIFGGELRGMPGITDGMVLYREPHWTRQSPNRKFFLSWATDLGLPLKKYQSPAHFMIHLGRPDGGPTRVIAPDGHEVFA